MEKEGVFERCERVWRLTFEEGTGTYRVYGPFPLQGEMPKLVREVHCGTAKTMEDSFALAKEWISRNSEMLGL